MMLVARTSFVLLGSMIWKVKVEHQPITGVAPVAALIFSIGSAALYQMLKVRLLPRVEHSLRLIDEFLDIEERQDPRQFCIASASASTSTSTAVLDRGHLRATHVMCRWGPDRDQVISDIDIDAQPGTLSVIRGPVASGKSALLECLLGEVEIAGGNLDIFDGAVGYCGKDLWLQEASVKDNIVGSAAWDKQWYELVIAACELSSDFALFPDRDSTFIRKTGLTLSSGQQTRVVSTIHARLINGNKKSPNIIF